MDFIVKLNIEQLCIMKGCDRKDSHNICIYMLNIINESLSCFFNIRTKYFGAGSVVLSCFGHFSPKVFSKCSYFKN